LFSGIRAQKEMMAERRPLYAVALSIGAIGVVFGDIGTSPLYALRESFVVAESLEVSRANVLGIVSLMFWALVLVVSVKYLAVVIRADNGGEGGILALTALLGQRTSRLGVLAIMVGLFGTALLYGDGIITPAISVLSAVEGLELAAPSLEPFVIPIASVILVALFAVQRKGTGAVGAVFGPTMLLWFVVLTVLGLYRLVDHPGILAAINPWHAVSFFGRHPGQSFLSLGAIFLVVTGSEALYADLGHFGKGPIRAGWFAVVGPALVINYMGQGALIISEPAAVENPFFNLPPSWGIYPLVILATVATVIASQALISGAFSLTAQAVQLGYLPRVEIDHTSPREIGQIYVPAVNYGLMVACVALVWTFRTSSNLAAAYGVAVTTTMVITTSLLYFVMREKWGWSKPVALAITAAFLVVDLGFFGANILKIPDGGWFPLVIGGLIFTMMVTWKRGRQLLASRLRRAELPIERFIASVTENPQIRVPGTAVYLFPEVGATPSAMLQNLRHNGVLHETMVLVSIQFAGRARVPRAQRTSVHDLGDDFYQIQLSYGFMEEPRVPEDLGNLVSPVFGFDDTEAVYVIGRETILSTSRPGMARWRERLFALMYRNTRSAAEYFGLPSDRVLEVGAQVEI
jgi:KUP system potassium uptake protein